MHYIRIFMSDDSKISYLSKGTHHAKIAGLSTKYEEVIDTHKNTTANSKKSISRKTVANCD